MCYVLLVGNFLVNSNGLLVNKRLHFHLLTGCCKNSILMTSCQCTGSEKIVFGKSKIKNEWNNRTDNGPNTETSGTYF